jgi:hypothetical protein
MIGSCGGPAAAQTEGIPDGPLILRLRAPRFNVHAQIVWRPLGAGGVVPRRDLLQQLQRRQQA